MWVSGTLQKRLACRSTHYIRMHRLEDMLSIFLLNVIKPKKTRRQNWTLRYWFRVSITSFSIVIIILILSILYYIYIISEDAMQRFIQFRTENTRDFSLFCVASLHSFILAFIHLYICTVCFTGSNQINLIEKNKTILYIIYYTYMCVRAEFCRYF